VKINFMYEDMIIKITETPTGAVNLPPQKGQKIKINGREFAFEGIEYSHSRQGSVATVFLTDPNDNK
jgi:hypothetical protein